MHEADQIRVISFNTDAGFEIGVDATIIWA